MNIENLNEQEQNNILTCSLIFLDGIHLRDAVLSVKNPIIALGLVPICAMYCHEAEGFLSQPDVIANVSKETLEHLQTTRLRLKLFNEKRYKRIKDTVLAIDDLQDHKYGEQLRFRFLRKNNLYYNIGLFFDEQKHLIGNTEYFASLFQDKKLTDEMLNEEVFQYAKQIGSIIRSILNLFGQNIPIKNERAKEIKVLFKDLNTNKDRIFDFQEDNKEIILLLLHLLGNVNYSLYIAEEIFPPCALKFRLQFISMYYAAEQLKVISEKCSDDNLRKMIVGCLNSLAPIINQQFRSCMMHYSLINHGHFEICREYLDLHKPFYGLIESCFDGQSFSTIQNQVINNLRIISETLSSFINIDLDHLNE